MATMLPARNLLVSGKKARVRCCTMLMFLKDSQLFTNWSTLYIGVLKFANKGVAIAKDASLRKGFSRFLCWEHRYRWIKFTVIVRMLYYKIASSIRYCNKLYTCAQQVKNVLFKTHAIRVRHWSSRIHSAQWPTKFPRSNISNIVEIWLYFVKKYRQWEFQPIVSKHLRVKYFADRFYLPGSWGTQSLSWHGMEALGPCYT